VGAVSVNGEDLDLTDTNVGASVALASGGKLMVTVDQFQKGEGTVATITTPLVVVTASLVRRRRPAQPPFFSLQGPHHVLPIHPAHPSIPFLLKNSQLDNSK
jgi:hypothetical protein